MSELVEPFRTADADRDEVLAAAAACVVAFGSHDTEDYFACFHPEATFLFHSSGRLLGSRAEYEAEWAAWEADGFRVLGCTSTDRRVDLWGDVAVLTHRVATTVRTSADGPEEEQQERETIVFRRDPGHPGRWLGVHEHLSVDPGPSAPDG